ncbi:hypothetical protein [Cysteiniphilum litorale]|uniref:hypothetical protein n=1 Tax=Cysteiniphilum litorale TaxID=2056700 RepID=UPI003F8833C1
MSTTIKTKITIANPLVLNCITLDLYFLIEKLNAGVYEQVVFNDSNPLERKGAFLGLNDDKSKLAYIPIARLDRFILPDLSEIEPSVVDDDNPSGTNVMDISLRARFAVQTTVRRALNATGLMLSESIILKLEQHFNTPAVKISHIKTGISDIYTMPRQGGGSLGSSCMQGKPKDWFEIYDNEPAIGCLVAMDRDGQLVGRAITWQVDSGATCCDRRYGTSSYIEEAIASYAMQNGMYCKSNNDYDLVRRWVNADKEIPSFQSVTLTQEEYTYYPYMDTFKYLNTYDGVLSCIDNSSHDAELTSTGGYSTSIGYCESCQEHCSSDNIRYADGIDVCDSCIEYYYSYCDDCNECTHRDNITSVQGEKSICQDCIDNDYLTCGECDEYVHADDLYRFECGDICSQCVEGAKP